MNIVVRAPNWLGDIVMSFPFFYALHDLYPAAAITVVAKKSFLPLFDLFNFSIEKMNLEEAKQRRHDSVDWYIALPPSFSSAWMGRFFFRAKRVTGYRGDWRRYLLTDALKKEKNIHRSKSYLHLISSDLNLNEVRSKMHLQNPDSALFLSSLPSSYTVININSEASSRRLPVHKWCELFLSLEEKTHLVFIGQEGERHRYEELKEKWRNQSEKKELFFHDFFGKTSILELFSLLKDSDEMISNDSGPAHLAALAGRKVRVFFGAGDDHETGPIGKEVQIIKKDISCSPCLKNSCPLKHKKCLEEIFIK